MTAGNTQLGVGSNTQFIKGRRTREHVLFDFCDVGAM